ncbi:flippase-like domain-containing protein [Candidatus Contubernalis alkaliaceticus]|uniref:flippase-like domain-containing protein n=1 Tax=Candidatus Contubernalis alkaliaceticus TaxID=338645 RepID=UPI001F4C02F5|nr:flippase-like domain-containing protein [Candidatus Contubernalis alkalaceticus]UNC93010.1 flippase-like domain-containing protein [Candidatus Contubernalis alkalaceticus]
MGKKPLLLLLGIIIITLMVITFGGDEIGSLLKDVNAKTIAVLSLIQLTTLSLTSYQWYFLLKKQNQEISFGKVWLLFLTGNFVESVTPSVKLGGEAARIYLFRQSTSLGYPQLTGMMLVQKYIILLPFLLLCSLVLITSSLLIQLPTAAYAAFILLALLVALLFKFTRDDQNQIQGKMVSQAAEEIYEKNSLKTFKEKLIAIIRRIKFFLREAAHASRLSVTGKEKCFLMSISLLVWILYPVKTLIAADMLGFSIGIFPLASAVFTAYMISMVPLLPGGLGSFEGSMTLMLTSMGLTPAEGLAVALVSRLVTYWFPLLLSLGAAAYLILNKESGLLQLKTHKYIILIRGLKKMEKLSNLLPLWYFKYPRAFILKLFTISVGIFEHLGSKYSFLGKLYGIFFYRTMITTEAEAAGLKPGMKVLHIGSGPLPMTAISLGRAGCSVTAVDSDVKAVKAASIMVKRAGMENQINVKEAHGQDLNCSSYDAVWISLHVFPKKKVILHSYKTLKDGGVLIYRNPGGWLKFLYPRLEPEEVDSSHQHQHHKLAQPMGKTTVILKKIFPEEKLERRACL